MPHLIILPGDEEEVAEVDPGPEDAGGRQLGSGRLQVHGGFWLLALKALKLIKVFELANSLL